MDVDKPLINIVLIGKFEQAVVYEGINKLYFACGRVGHKKEMCPHIVRRAELPSKKEVSCTKVSSTSPRKMHVPGGCKTVAWQKVVQRSTAWQRVVEWSMMRTSTDHGWLLHVGEEDKKGPRRMCNSWTPQNQRRA